MDSTTGSSSSLDALTNNRSETNGTWRRSVFSGVFGKNPLQRSECFDAVFFEQNFVGGCFCVGALEVAHRKPFYRAAQVLCCHVANVRFLAIPSNPA